MQYSFQAVNLHLAFNVWGHSNFKVGQMKQLDSFQFLWQRKGNSVKLLFSETAIQTCGVCTGGALGRSRQDAHH